MKKVKALIIIILMICISIGVAISDIYKWVDENGVTHFSDQPPQSAGSAGEVESIPTYDYKYLPASGSDHESQDQNVSLQGDPYTGKKSKQLKKPKVELYTTSWCPYCEKARNFFRSRGISFAEYDIEMDKSAARRKKQLDTRKGVPFAIVNGKRIHGFSKAAYARALEENP